MSFLCDGCGEFERFMHRSDRMHGGGEGKACCERPTSRHLAVCLMISSIRDFGKCEMIDSMLA